MDYRNTRSGQAMLIAVLSLGGAILGATAIAGLLMLYQLRAATDAQNSAKAIFGADAGVEYALYSYFCSPLGRCVAAPPPPVFSNGVTTTVVCYDASNAAIPCDTFPGVATAISKGTSLQSRRAFFLDLTAATSTFP